MKSLQNQKERRIIMKKFLSFVLCILMVVQILAPINVSFATDAKSEDLLWEYAPYGEGIMLTQYLGSATDVYVPSSLDVNDEKLAVIKLGDGIFQNNDALNSVTLGEGILEIGGRCPAQGADIGGKCPSPGR